MKKKRTGLKVLMFFLILTVIAAGAAGYYFREEIGSYYKCQIITDHREQYQCFSELPYQFTQDKADKLFRNEVTALFEQGSYREVVDLITSDYRYISTVRIAQVGIGYEIDDDVIREAFAESNYQLAEQLLEEGKPEEAYDHLKMIEQYMDVSEEINEAQYQYVLSHQSRDDEKTVNYLTRLKDAGYKDSAVLYDNIVDLKVRV